MRRVIRNIVLAGLCLILIGFAGISVEASERVINTDDEWVSGSLENDVQYYKFTIPMAGKVTYTFQSYSDDGRCILLDKDWDKEYGVVNCDGSSVSPVTKSGTHDMEAGIYYLKICNYWSGATWTGDYRVKVSYTVANNNETEPNNSFEEAMPLIPENLVTGYITDDDNLDFYKITLREAQHVEIIWTNSAKYVYFGVWNSDLLAVKKDDDYYTGSHIWEGYLQPGTYYIKFGKDGNDTGTYTVKYRTKQYVSQINMKQSKVVLSKGASYHMLSSVAPSGATNKELDWSSSNTDVATVSMTGEVTAKRAGYAWITAESMDGSKVKAESVVVVKPGKAQITKLELSSYDKRKVYVYFKGMDGVSGYQMLASKNKNFSKKKSYSTSSTSMYQSGLKVKTRYYYKVRAYVEYDGTKYYGSWSNVKSIKTKK